MSGLSKNCTQSNYPADKKQKPSHLNDGISGGSEAAHALRLWERRRRSGRGYPRPTQRPNAWIPSPSPHASHASHVALSKDWRTSQVDSPHPLRLRHYNSSPILLCSPMQSPFSVAPIFLRLELVSWHNVVRYHGHSEAWAGALFRHQSGQRSRGPRDRKPPKPCRNAAEKRFFECVRSSIG